MEKHLRVKRLLSGQEALLWQQYDRVKTKEENK